MSRVRSLLMLIGVALVSYLVGTMAERQPGPAHASRTDTPLYYRCPMHPSYKSDRSGVAPCCGMGLEAVYAGTTGTAASTPKPAGLIHIAADRRPIVGIATEQVKRSVPPVHRRLTGRVTADETKTWRLNASTNCWIRQVYAPTTGTMVKKDELLLSFYTTSFLSAANSYLYALSTLDRHREAGTASGDQRAIVDTQLRQAVESLQILGVSDYQINRMGRTRVVDPLVELRAPVDGLILSRSVSPGQFITAGTEMYRIGDLSHVWVMADVFGHDAARVRPGQLARVTSLAPPATVSARVSSALPQLDPESRTLKVRLEVDNPKYVLRPDMFVDVELDVALAPGFFVPASAILDSGLRRTVFVERVPGYFEQVPVTTGTHADHLVEIRDGLRDGDAVVVSGNFLLDSETRMTSRGRTQLREPAAKAMMTDPLCGMQVDSTTARWRVESKGKSVWFCSESCMRKYKSQS